MADLSLDFWRDLLIMNFLIKIQNNLMNIWPTYLTSSALVYSIFGSLLIFIMIIDVRFQCYIQLLSLAVILKENLEFGSFKEFLKDDLLFSIWLFVEKREGYTFFSSYINLWLNYFDEYKSHMISTSFATFLIIN